MPMFVNRQYADLHPKSEQFGDGFILWDVVAFYAMVHPEFFSDWTSFDILFLPERDPETGSKLEARISLKKNAVLYGEDHLINAHSVEGSKESNRVIIPMVLRNESALHEHLLKHLFVEFPGKDTTCNSVNTVLTPIVKLGLLPHMLAMCTLISIIMLFVFRRIVTPIYTSIFKKN